MRFRFGSAVRTDETELLMADIGRKPTSASEPGERLERSLVVAHWIAVVDDCDPAGCQARNHLLERMANRAVQVDVDEAERNVDERREVEFVDVDSDDLRAGHLTVPKGLEELLLRILAERELVARDVVPAEVLGCDVSRCEPRERVDADVASFRAELVQSTC